jgi:general secretion pathway protein D
VTANRYDYVRGITGAYRSDNNLIKDRDDPVVPPMPLGPSQGGSALNLFNLDQMRREQAVPARRQPQPQPGAQVQTAPVQAATVQTAPVPAAGLQAAPVQPGVAAQMQPAQPGVPVQMLPAQSPLTTQGERP